MDESPSCEFGSVATLKKHFGFIRCSSRARDVFFHFNDLVSQELQPLLSPGFPVKFCLTKDPSTGRLVAKKVDQAPAELAASNVIAQDRLIGQVVGDATATGPASASQIGFIRYNMGHYLHVVEACKHGSMGTAIPMHCRGRPALRHWTETVKDALLRIDMDMDAWSKLYSHHAPPWCTHRADYGPLPKD